MFLTILGCSVSSEAHNKIETFNILLHYYVIPILSQLSTSIFILIYISEETNIHQSAVSLNFILSLYLIHICN